MLKLHPEVHEINTQNTQNKPKHIPDDIWTKYSDIFYEKPGILPVTYKMKLNPEVHPVIRSARRVPNAIHDKVKKSLDNMVNDGIIAKVTEPTEWVSCMVAAEK